MSIRTRDTLRALVVRRSRELGKSMTTLAKESGISRTYLYGLAGGASQDPSVRTLIKLAKALQVSPLLLFRYFADLAGAPVDIHSMARNPRFGHPARPAGAPLGDLRGTQGNLHRHVHLAHRR